MPLPIAPSIQHVEFPTVPYLTVSPVWRLAASVGFILLAAACGRPTPADPENRILARVGPETITVREFRQSYETAFGMLKSRDNPKGDYLEHMINERLLALEGYRLELDDLGWVTAAEEGLRRELMIEELIRREVRSGISVSMAEIREEINRSKVSFQFRFWPERTREAARRTAADMRQRGFAAVVDDRIAGNPEMGIDPADLTTDYITPQDVRPELLSAIEDLPYGDISDPVELNGQWFIFQVLDIRRQGVTTTEYETRASSIEQVLFYRKLEAETRDYVAALLTPLNIRTHADAYNRLGNALLAWQRNDSLRALPFMQAVMTATPEQGALHDLATHLDAPFFSAGDLTVPTAEFLTWFSTARLKALPGQPRDLEARFDNGVAMTIRDFFLAKEARRRGLDAAPRVETELNRWRDKWVYEASRGHFSDPYQPPDSLARAWFDANPRQWSAGERIPAFQEVAEDVRRELRLRHTAMKLRETARELRERFPVTVDSTVLDTISVIEFEKSRWASLQLIKGGSNRQAFPTADPLWFFLREE